MKLETERLILRPTEIADATALSQLWTDPEVTRHMGGPRNYEEIYEEFMEDARNESPPDFDLWPVTEKSTGQLVGHCGLIDKEVEGKVEIELVYVLKKDAWGKGYATEIANSIANRALNQFGLKKIIALINPQNSTSENVAKKIGMKFEKEILRPNGELMRIYSKSKST